MDDPTGRAPSERGPWAWAAAVAAALVIITVGAIVGMTTSGGGGSTATSGAASSGQTETAAASVPPTVTVPQATETGGAVETGGVETGGAVETGTTGGNGGTSTQAGGGAIPGLTAWPAGKDGYTVVLASVAESKGQDAAASKARKAKAAGLPQVGVLLSSDYSTLNAGFWVVFSGVYDTLADASLAVSAARTAGFPDAYPRNVAP